MKTTLQSENQLIYLAESKGALYWNSTIFLLRTGWLECTAPFKEEHKLNTVGKHQCCQTDDEEKCIIISGLRNTSVTHSHLSASPIRMRGVHTIAWKLQCSAIWKLGNIIQLLQSTFCFKYILKLSKKTKVCVCFAILVTQLCSGLWHINRKPHSEC